MLDELRGIVSIENHRARQIPNNSKGVFPDEKWLPLALKNLMIDEFHRKDNEKTHIAIIKYFNPCGDGTWYVSEYDPENDEFFGLCVLSEPELGYVSNKELRSIRTPIFRLPLERDLWFHPEKLSILQKEEKAR